MMGGEEAALPIIKLFTRLWLMKRPRCSEVGIPCVKHSAGFHQLQAERYQGNELRWYGHSPWAIVIRALIRANVLRFHVHVTL